MTEAQKERDDQRSESEARDIIHDIDRLNTFPENKKTRWVWELLQNAKDVAKPNGVDVIFKLENDKVTISHNGAPFETKHLLAILYKTSTKTLGGEDGTTGKYGTGFVTTHILNKKMRIEGVHQNIIGLRRFSLELDRTPATLENNALKATQESLRASFNKIDEISATSPDEVIGSDSHSFIYPLTDYSKKYAENGMIELERNIQFTLLINQREKKRINSITINSNGVERKVTVIPEPSKIPGLDYIKVNDSEGILYTQKDRLLFGIPVQNLDDTYRLKSLDKQSVLFKEFPLVGTENFNLPVFIQHNDFKPTELRDGVRTKKENEEAEDHTADTNRNALTEFLAEYTSFLNLLISAKVKNLHQLVLSGLPSDVENYSNKDWYIKNVQKPIRDFLGLKDIVQTVSGDFVTIDKATFPSAELVNDEDFYSLLSNLLPCKVPIIDSKDFWNEVIHQEIEYWPNDITISLEALLGKIPSIIDLESENSFVILGELYSYLEKINSTLGEKYPIYLNEKKEFKTRIEVVLYPQIDDEIKAVSAGLGRDLDEEFLNKRLGTVAGIKEFELMEFYKTLNTELISKVPEKSATPAQTIAILHVCSLFRSDRALKREKWYAIVRQLLPEQIGDKKSISIDYENYGSSAELWAIKYISHLIETQNTILNFAKTYFEDNAIVCFEWLNDFLTHVFSMSDENKIVLFQRKIIPVQTGEFKDYSEFRFLEDNPKYFDESIKDIYKTYTAKGDPRGFLIDNRIKIEAIKKISIDILTKEIDKLFDDSDVEKKVKKEGILHDAFLKLNNWFEQYPEASGDLKTFANKRAMLYVIALGEGFGKQVMSLRDSGKSMEDIVALAQINLTTQEMQALEKVALELGTGALLAKAQQLIDVKNQRIRWQKIGKSAEDAFKKMFESLQMDIDLSNPDIGKDFELTLKTKGYSIEIKNVIEGKENVRMSILQGKTAVLEKENYALCVMTRPNDEAEIDDAYFIEHASFVTDIGCQIGDKINNWDKGLISLNQNEDIRVNLDEKTESVYINKSIWRDGIPFSKFVDILKNHFENETN